MDILERFNREVKLKDFYRALTTRKFTSPKGYSNYEDICLKIASNLEAAELGIEAKGFEWTWLCALDIFERLASDLLFPVFRVDRELTELLIEADEPKQFSETLPCPFETALFLLPKGLISIAGWDVDWIVIDAIDSSESERVFELSERRVIFSRLNDRDGIRFRWVTEVSGDLFVSTFGYDELGKEVEKHPQVTLTEGDLSLTAILTKLTKGLLLWLDRPQEYEYEIVPPKGFGKKAVVGDRARYPIRLGINSQPHRIGRAAVESGNKRRSPVPHIRRAHWRRVAVGVRSEGRRELKLIPRSRIGEIPNIGNSSDSN